MERLVPTVLPMASIPAAVPLPVPNTNGTSIPQTNGISADEIALYDRQIRLWGLQAQEKIRSAHVLLITMKALANEIAKNLVLAGIGSLTVVDHEAVTEADLGAQFFLSAEDGHLGRNRAEAAVPQIRRLNPRVAVHADAADIRSKAPSYFAPFDVVIATDLDPDTLNVINTATRLHRRPFYAAGTHGLYGFIFADLIEHDFVVRRAEPNVATALGPETKTRSVVAVHPARGDDGRPVEVVTKRESYSTWLLASDLARLPPEYARHPRRLRAVSPALSCLRALWAFQAARAGRLPASDARDDLHAFTRLATRKHADLALPPATLRADFLRSFLQNVAAELAPVAAVLGGQLAQDVINVLGRALQPIQNMVVFDGNTMEASMYPLHPDGPLGAQLLDDPAPAAARALDAAATAAAAAMPALASNGTVGDLMHVGDPVVVDGPVL